MKILLTADIHYTLKQLDWLSEVADRFDLLVIAGDLLDMVSVVDLDVQILVVMKYLRKMQSKVKMLVSSGNHDLDALCSRSGENVAEWMSQVRDLGVPTDGDSWEIEDILFTICPWWDGEVSKQEVAAHLERDASRTKKRWFWVYHTPPVATEVSWDGKRDFGDAVLREWVLSYGPELVLGGHIHQAPFVKGGNWVDRLGDTWLLNSGKQIGPVPTFTIIDTNEQTAEWVSLAGREEIDFETGAKSEF